MAASVIDGLSPAVETIPGPRRRSWQNPTTADNARAIFGQGRPMAKSSSGNGANWWQGTLSDKTTALGHNVESRFFFEGTVAATDMSRATDAREAGRIGIFGTSNSYGGSYGRVTNEAIGRDLNPLGRGGGQALVGGWLNVGRIAARLTRSTQGGGRQGNGANNGCCGSSGGGVSPDIMRPVVRTSDPVQNLNCKHCCNDWPELMKAGCQGLIAVPALCLGCCPCPTGSSTTNWPVLVFGNGGSGDGPGRPTVEPNPPSKPDGPGTVNPGPKPPKDCCYKLVKKQCYDPTDTDEECKRVYSNYPMPGAAELCQAHCGSKGSGGGMAWPCHVANTKCVGSCALEFGLSIADLDLILDILEQIGQIRDIIGEGMDWRDILEALNRWFEEFCTGVGVHDKICEIIDKMLDTKDFAICLACCLASTMICMGYVTDGGCGDNSNDGAEKIWFKDHCKGGKAC